jgi:hypothetical protein
MASAVDDDADLIPDLPPHDLYPPGGHRPARGPFCSFLRKLADQRESANAGAPRV